MAWVKLCTASGYRFSSRALSPCWEKFVWKARNKTNAILRYIEGFFYFHLDSSASPIGRAADRLLPVHVPFYLAAQCHAAAWSTNTCKSHNLEWPGNCKGLAMRSSLSDGSTV